MSTTTRETGPPTVLRLLLIQEDGCWLAQCIDYDIVAQASSLKDVKYEFEKLFVTHIVASLENDLEPFKNVPPAPAEMLEKWEAAADRIEPRTDWPKFRLPPGVASRYPALERPDEIRLMA